MAFAWLLAAAAAAVGPSYAGCPVLPAGDAFNQDVAAAAVDPQSGAYVASIGADSPLHPDFGSGRQGDFGMPIRSVPRGQKRVPIRFAAFPEESDPGPYPIPPKARVEGGAGADGDRHVVVVRRGTCRLYELFRAFKRGKGWTADSGAVFDLRAGTVRPAGFTSADAAGLPILPGLARPDEADGVIRHALRFTVPRTQDRYVPPARHAASDSDDPALPPMGQRFRLKADVPLAGYTGQALAILTALKRYGMIVADNGSPWFVSGTADRRWDDADLEQLTALRGSDFEAVVPG